MVALLLLAILITLLSAWAFVGGAVLFVIGLIVAAVVLWLAWAIIKELVIDLLGIPDRLRKWWHRWRQMTGREKFAEIRRIINQRQ